MFLDFPKSGTKTHSMNENWFYVRQFFDLPQKNTHKSIKPGYHWHFVVYKIVYMCCRKWIWLSIYVKSQVSDQRQRSSITDTPHPPTAYDYKQ